MSLAILAAVTLLAQPDGASLSLRLDDKPVITGLLTQNALKIVQTQVLQDSPTLYTVEIDYADHSHATSTYGLEGQDLTVDYKLTNGSDKPQTIDLAGLTCGFTPGAKITGTLASFIWTYYANLVVWHPSIQCPLGVVYASDAHTAAVFYSPSEAGARSLLNAQWTVHPGISNPFRLEFHTRRIVAPGASDHASIVARVTNDLSPEGLYGGYKRFLREIYPTALYTPAAGPMAMSSSVDAYHVTKDDPLGYNGDMRRFDRPQGVAAFLHWIADPLATMHGQGCIFWAPGGAEPAMYPPDFDANLERIAGTWPLLVAGFKERGLRIGLCARAANDIDRSQPDHPVVTRIDPDDPKQVEKLLGRFRNVAQMGVNAYYLDSFGGDWASARLLPAIRKTVGPDTPIYTEYCTDATLPYADRYCEYWGGDTVSWDSPEQLAALRFLFPESVWLCLSRTSQPWPNDFQRLHLTPIIQDYSVQKALAGAL